MSLNLLRHRQHRLRHRQPKILEYELLQYVPPSSKERILKVTSLEIRTEADHGDLQYPAIKNAPLPADSASSEQFSNILLFSLIALVPAYLARQVGGGLFTWIFFALFTSIPTLVTFWYVASAISPRKNEKARYPGKPVEHYLHFHSEKDRATYRGKAKIPMETFHEMYFDGAVDFKGDALEVMEYRHDWANFKFTLSLFRFFLTGMMPEVIMHSRSQGMHSNFL